MSLSGSLGVAKDTPGVLVASGSCEDYAAANLLPGADALRGVHADPPAAAALRYR